MFLFEDITKKIEAAREEARVSALAETQRRVAGFVNNMIVEIHQNKSIIEALVIARALGNDKTYAKVNCAKVLVASCDENIISEDIKNFIGEELGKACITDGDVVSFYLWSETTLSQQSYFQIEGVDYSTSNVLLVFKLM